MGLSFHLSPNLSGVFFVLALLKKAVSALQPITSGFQ